MYDDDKYLILTNSRYMDEINLINVNFKDVLNSNKISNCLLKIFDKEEYNIFENLCINNNFVLIQWYCKKNNFDNSKIFFVEGETIERFMEKYIQYSIKNNNLKMLKYGINFNKDIFKHFIEEYLFKIQIDNTKILKWLLKHNNLYCINCSPKIFNINYYFYNELNNHIRFIVKKYNNFFLDFKIDNLSQKKYKILIWLISNTNISLDDIELILLLNIKNSYRKNLYEILIKKFNNIEFFKIDKIYFYNIKTVF